MRIAFFHELPFGGAYRTVYEYGKALRKLGHQCELYYVSDREDKENRSYFNRIYFYQFLPKKYSGNDPVARLYKDTIELVKLRDLHARIAKEIDSRNYDFAFIHPSKFTQAPFILNFLKTKKIYYCHEPLRLVYDSFVCLDTNHLPFYKKYYEKLNRIMRKKIDRKNLDSADLILVNSKFTQDWVKMAYSKDSEVCYHGVDTSKFKPIKMKKTFDVLFLGEKTKIEGWDLLEDSLEFFSKKPKIKVVQRTQSGKGIPDSELVKEYNRAKIVVCLSRNEPFGLVPLEAMACGVPVVAVQEGGFVESVVNGKSGYLIARNPEKLYKAIKTLLNNEKLRNKMGQYSVRYIRKNWSWDNSAANLIRIMNTSIRQ